ncbi:MAG: hypothetical protein ACJA0P_002372 [Planctomycetota bacterium]|jgi:hypothetical protein
MLRARSGSLWIEGTPLLTGIFPIATLRCTFRCGLSRTQWLLIASWQVRRHPHRPMTEPSQHTSSHRPWPARGLSLAGLILSTAAVILSRQVAPLDAWQLPASGAASILFLGLAAWGLARLRPVTAGAGPRPSESGPESAEDAS